MLAVAFLAQAGCTTTQLLPAVTTAPVPRTWAIPAPLQPITVNGYDMAVLDKGSGVPVVLVHGSTSDYRVWFRQWDVLAERYRALAVNLRHHQPEPWNGQGGHLSARQHAADVAALIRTLGEGPVHLVGISRGAQVALQAALLDPKQIRTLTLADPAPLETLLESPEALAAWRHRQAYVDEALARLRAGDVAGGLGHFIDGVNGPGSWQVSPASTKQLVQANAWSLVSLPSDAREPVRCADLARLTAPVLLLNGANSPALYHEMVKAIQPCLRAPAQHQVIPAASHGMQFQNPAAFNPVLLSFLDTH